MNRYVPKKLRERSIDASKKSTTRSVARPKSAAKKNKKPHTPGDRPAVTTKNRPSPHGAPRAKSTLKNALARERRRTRFLGITSIIGVILAVSLWLANTSAVFGSLDHGEAAGKAAKTTAAALFSYDYRDFDAAVSNGAKHSAGDFAKQWKKTTAGLKATAIKEKAQVIATVVDVAVLNANAEYTDDSGAVYKGTVEVLAFMDQVSRNANIEGQKIDQSRVVLTMAFIDGTWKAVGAVGI